MQQAGNPDPIPSEDQTAWMILTILTEHYPALLSFDEVVSEYAGLSRDRGQAHLMVVDGLAALMGSGLAHKLDRFVVASRAAIRFEQLRV